MGAHSIVVRVGWNCDAFYGFLAAFGKESGLFAFGLLKFLYLCRNKQ
jgi:hypothetical protein